MENISNVKSLQRPHLKILMVQAPIPTNQTSWWKWTCHMNVFSNSTLHG